MGRGPTLTDRERGMIDALHEEGFSLRQIADKIGRSKGAIHNHLSRPIDYVSGPQGRRPSLSERDLRHIHRAASNQMTSSRRIKNDLGLQVSTRTVRRALNQDKYLSYDKMRRGPWFNPAIMRRRLAWAQEYNRTINFWQTVIFSDEKKFNLDGPDGLRYYWHDLRKDKLRFSKRQSGGGSIMFWGGLGAAGLTSLVKINGRMDSTVYQKVLSDNLLPAAPRIGGREWIFQQDMAPCHRSKSTKQWFEARNIATLAWPGYSPDLNITENLWGVMARAVYPDGKQYLTLQELENACQRAWAEITQEYITSLFESLPRRVNELIENNGGPTSY